MSEANMIALKTEIVKDFKKEFDYDLCEEDFTDCDDGVEILYRDYNLNNFDKYHHSPLIESCKLINDGRESYIEVYGYLKYDDYFGID